MSTSEAGQPFDITGAGEPVPAPPRSPKGKPVALIIVAVVLLVTTATFGALWLVERGNHETTTQQLTTKSEQLTTREKELSDEKAAHTTTKGQLSDAEKAKTTAEGKVSALTPCADSAKEFVKLVLTETATDAQGEKAGEALVLSCK